MKSKRTAAEERWMVLVQWQDAETSVVLLWGIQSCLDNPVVVAIVAIAATVGDSDGSVGIGNIEPVELVGHTEQGQGEAQALALANVQKSG